MRRLVRLFRVLAAAAPLKRATAAWTDIDYRTRSAARPVFLKPRR